MGFKLLVTGGLLVSLAGFAFADQTATSPSVNNNQHGHYQHTRNSVLLLETTSTALGRALTACGVGYDEAFGPPFPSPAGYAAVFLGMDGGLLEDSDIAPLADYAASGGCLNFYGGTCWQDYAISMNNRLVNNDINNYCWTEVFTQPEMTVTDPGCCLASGLPGTYNWTDLGASFYQFRSNDTGLACVAAVNGDGFNMLFSKSIGSGNFNYCIDSAYDGYYSNQTDFNVLQQIVCNMSNCCGGPNPTQETSWGQIKSTYK